MDKNCKLFPYLKKALCCDCCTQYFFNDNCNMISFILQSVYFICEKNRVGFKFVGLNQYYLKEGCHGVLDRYGPFLLQIETFFCWNKPSHKTKEKDSHI